jgi:hypothetical protein
MRVTDDTFYVVSLAGEREIYDGEEEAISHLRESAGEIDPENEDVSVARVTIEGDDWTIKELPWQQIALRLLQEG